MRENAGDFRTVILDPGHGGKDPGATNSLNTEATYNLKVATRAKALLEKEGYKVIMTRRDDHYLTLQERVDFANAIKENKPELAMSNFDYAGRLTETVLLGNIALRAGKKVEWDGVNMKVTNDSAANQFVTREYRHGWDL